MTYTPTTWADSPATTSPITAAALNNIETAVSAHDAALPGKAPIASAWLATTAYKANQLVTNGGQLWSAKVDFTSGASFSSANWNLIGSAGGAAALAPTAVKTGAYTAAVSDLVPVDTTSASVTITLPAAPADGSQIGVKHVIRGGTNTVTINCGGSDVFNKTGGATTTTLTLLDQNKLFQYKASTGIWYITDDSLTLAQLDLRFAPIIGTLTINSQTGTTYTFALGDGNGSTLVELTNAAAVAATIPPNSSVAFPVGTVLLIGQGGAGQVTLTAGAGVTIRTPNGAKTAQQWSQATATQRAANDWIISGDTSA